MDPSLSFDTVISFMTNTNLQHYAGESGLSYLNQMLVIILRCLYQQPAAVLPVQPSSVA